jgi:hypothetical protein
LTPISIGVDPGWTSLGYACVAKTEDPFKFSVLATGTLNPSLGPEECIENIPNHILTSLPNPVCDFQVSDLVIERYVAYENIRSSSVEDILQVIGMLRMHYHLISKNNCSTIKTTMIRAIDWKVKLVQTLSKYCQFQNPSSDLDKKFSVAAAKFLVVNPETITTNHEADAICLAAYPYLARHVQGLESQRKRGPTTISNA